MHSEHAPLRKRAEQRSSVREAGPAVRKKAKAKQNKKGRKGGWSVVAASADGPPLLFPVVLLFREKAIAMHAATSESLKKKVGVAVALLVS